MWDTLLDALGYAGDALDKPGRAVRGLLSGNAREGLAAVPFSDSLGLTDPGERVSGKQLLGTDSDLLGLGAELATDPLTLLGSGLGSRLGRLAGGRLSEAAVARGPGYGTKLEDLQGLARPGSLFEQKLAELADSPNIGRILQEIPVGSRPIGAGEEAAALMTPRGDVLRIGQESAGKLGRPIDEGVLGATRSVDIPFAGTAPGGVSVRAERLPYATNVGNTQHWAATYGTGTNRMTELAKDLQTRGLRFHDRHTSNVGTVGGRPVVIDPGAIDASAFAGGFQPVAHAAEPGLLMRGLLDAMGGQAATRRALDAGLAAPDFARGLAELGAGAGVAGAAGWRAGR